MGRSSRNRRVQDGPGVNVTPLMLVENLVFAALESSWTGGRRTEGKELGDGIWEKGAGGKTEDNRSAGQEARNSAVRRS